MDSNLATLADLKTRFDKAQDIAEQLKKEAFLKRKANLDALQKQLFETFPDLFNPHKPKPLAIGIHKEIKAALPDFSQKLIRLFMAGWVKRKAYLEALINAAHRVSLEGMTGEEITSTQKEAATLLLAAKVKLIKHRSAKA